MGSCIPYMADYDKWIHFRTATRLKNVSSFEDLVQIEDKLLFLAETEEIKELLQRRSLLSYEFHELEVQKFFNKNLANFKNNVPSAHRDFLRLRFLHKALRDITSKHRAERTLAVQKFFNENLANFKNNVPSTHRDFLRLRFLHKALRDITSKHRAERTLAVLQLTVPEVSIIRVAPVHLPLLALEFSSLANQAKAAARTMIPQIVQQINELTEMTSHEHWAQENEPPVQQQAHQAQRQNQLATTDGPKTLEQQPLVEKYQSQTHSSFGSSWELSVHTMRTTRIVVGPNPSSAANNSTDHQGKHSSEMPLVVYTTQLNPFDSKVLEQPISSAAPKSLAPPTLQFMDTTTKALTSLTDCVSSLELTYACMKFDTDITRHHTTLLRDKLTSDMDGLEIKIDVLENTMSSKLADSQQSFAVLETTMVRNYADIHQQLVEELALVKSQLAEMIDCIKELSDAKKGQGGSSGKKSEVPTRRSGGEGPSGEKSSIHGRGPSPRGGRGPSP
ncbi:hypothetical protein F511_39158 [Dorcoceras hygrometricum]|uniref:Uncharacterized protein n=1 Tax=Dorcoceras hygrometricum TaxID=472368 RepID=A0A2Z7D0X7_9LAMI|nr:hypothetical protein F511_39158 [Dorcoceras hygrometricum]